MENYSNKIERTYENELLWSEPINYKGITLYPVTCQNIRDFNKLIPALLYDPFEVFYRSKHIAETVLSY